MVQTAGELLERLADERDRDELDTLIRQPDWSGAVESPVNDSRIGRGDAAT